MCQEFSLTWRLITILFWAGVEIRLPSSMRAWLYIGKMTPEIAAAGEAGAW